MASPVLDPRRAPRRGYERRPGSTPQPQFRPSTGFRPTSTRDVPERSPESIAPTSPTDFYSPEAAEQKALHLVPPTGDKAAEAERQKVADDDSGYFRGGEDEKGGVRGWAKRRKRRLIGGGIAGLAVGGGFALFTFLAGPLQFVHFAQLLSRFHLDDNAEITENRLGKAYRYLKHPDDPARSRLGIIGNKFATAAENALRERGFDPKYTDLNTGSPTTSLTHFELDPDIVDLDSLERDGWEIVDGPNGRPIIIIEGTNATRRGFTRAVYRATDISKITSSVHLRSLNAKTGARFRWFGNVKRNASDTFVSWDQRRRAQNNEYLKEGAPDVTFSGDVAGAEQNPAEAAANQSAADQANAARQDPDIGKAKISKIKAGLTVAALPSLVCGAYAISGAAEDVKYANTVLPAIRLGVGVLAAGGGVMYGGADNPDLLNEMSIDSGKFFEVLKNEEGEVIRETSAFSAASIQAELGEPITGPDIPDSARPDKQGLAVARFLEAIPGSGAIETICGNSIFQGLSAVLDIGGFIVGEVSEALFGTSPEALVTDELIKLLAGEEINIDVAGADYGNIGNYGMRHAANEGCMAMGCVALDDVQEDNFENWVAEAQLDEFQSRPLFARLFSLDGQYSFASKLLTGMTKRPQPMDAVNLVLSAPTTAFSSFLKLGSQPVYAQADYSYGFAKMGIPVEVLESEEFADPFNNVGDVASIPGEPQRLKDKYYEKCKGAHIDVNTGQIDIKPGGINVYDLDPICTDASDRDLYTYSFYLLDAMNMAGNLCYKGDETLCRELGFGTTVTAAGDDVPPAGSSIVGDPYTDTTSVPCAVGTREIGIHNGYVDGRLFPVRLCSLPNLPSGGPADNPGHEFSIPGADGHAIVNSRVSGAWFALVNDAAAAGINLSSGSSFRTEAHQEYLWDLYGRDPARVAPPGYSPHQAGVAIDFSGMHSFISGASCAGRASYPSSPGWVWLRDNAERYGFKQYAAEAWHWDALPATNRCGTP